MVAFLVPRDEDVNTRDRDRVEGTHASRFWANEQWSVI